MVARGELGVKTGRGFYSWDPDRDRARNQQIAQVLVGIAQRSERT
jgi:3-hydroxyacyl-CoA dehydrogenase